MNAGDYERVLLDATEQVRRRVNSVAEDGARSTALGFGASGDRTLLADKEAEDILLAALHRIGGVRVLSEEAGVSGSKGDRMTAVVDPLDGSSNFSRGIPFYCSSVAIAEGPSLSDVEFGVVRDLVSGDVYVARRGAGATKNDKPIRTSAVDEAAEAVVGIDVSGTSSKLVQGLSGLMAGVKRQVHFGANALELCLVADARIDAFVDVRSKIRVTDFAAAYLIAREAGAKVTDPEGKEMRAKFNLKDRFSFVASANETLHGEILRLSRGSQGRWKKT